MPEMVVEEDAAKQLLPYLEDPFLFAIQMMPLLTAVPTEVIAATAKSIVNAKVASISRKILTMCTSLPLGGPMLKELNTSANAAF